MRDAALISLLLVLGLTAGDGAPSWARELQDRLVAVVDDDPILLSDVERVIALGLAVPREGESPEALQRRVLDELIVQRLRYHEVDRYGFGDVPRPRVDEQMEAIAIRLGGRQALVERLAQLGMDEPALRRLVSRQLEVFTYVDELLGARVFVGLEEIERHYQEVLKPALENSGAPVPPLEKVRELIRERLRQELLNEQLEIWTEQLRRAADVVVYPERPARLLPPAVTVEGSSSATVEP